MNRFPDRARVCFVGDSITHDGTFLKHIVAHYRALLPKSCVEFYNCGIGGGDLANTLAVYEEDIAIYRPTHIVLMIGVNDSRRGRLDDPITKERYEKLLAAYEAYKANVEAFYQRVTQDQVELILCTPMPYAEYMESDASALRGGYALILGYAAYVREFAQSKGLSLCDYHTAATAQMQTERLYENDRVHPNPRGHAVMAKTFLEAQGLEWNESLPFSEELEKWQEATQKLRNIAMTEFFLVPNALSLDTEERLAIIQKRYDDLQNGSYHPGALFQSLIEGYVTDKPRQAEFLSFVKEWMKH